MVERELKKLAQAAVKIQELKKELRIYEKLSMVNIGRTLKKEQMDNGMPKMAHRFFTTVQLPICIL